MHLRCLVEGRFAFPFLTPLSTRASLQDALHTDVVTRAPLQGALSTDADARASLQDALPTEAGAHAPLRDALPTLGDFPLCGNCDVDFPPLGFVPTSGCGKLCRCDTAVIEPCFNEVLEHDSAIELNDDPEMPALFCASATPCSTRTTSS